MKRVLIIGQRVSPASIATLFQNELSLEFTASIPADFSAFDVILDTSFDLDTTRLATYMANPPAILMLHALNSGISKCFFQQKLAKPQSLVVGVNILPGFAERNLLEISNPFFEQQSCSDALSAILAVSPRFTQDRIGMVSARILMMVINEAWYTLEEGTAGQSDIDTGMKLGTNYPKGPFEWTSVIGAKEIVAALDALFEDTHDSRYKVCALLRQQAYRSDIS